MPDSFLRVRTAGDHEATAMMKAQFLQQWDGLSTDQTAHVIVMAATNRPTDVDRAILRRLPAAFYVKLPVRCAVSFEIYGISILTDTLSSYTLLTFLYVQV